MTVDARELIEELRCWIQNEKELIEHYTRKLETAQECLARCHDNLNRFEERLAAELSQVSA